MKPHTGAYSPEADEFLSSHTRSFVGNLRKDGSPTGHPLTALYRDGVLYYNTYLKSAKMRNILRDPRVSCLICTSDDETPFRALSVRGRMMLIESLQEAMAFYERGASRTEGQRPRATSGGGRTSGGASPTTGSRDRLLSGKRALMRLESEEFHFVK